MFAYTSCNKNIKMDENSMIYNKLKYFKQLKKGKIMAIKIKTVAKGQPGVTGGGEKKYYVVSVMGGEWNIDKLTGSIEKICTVSGADIRAVLYALVDVAVDGLENGNIIRLGDLGSMRVTLSSEGRTTPEEIGANCIRKSGIIFVPGARIKKMLQTANYRKEIL
jgi:predicted histone-like DNA-binding protein